jgi:hypothetical protein
MVINEATTPPTPKSPKMPNFSVLQPYLMNSDNNSSTMIPFSKKSSSVKTAEDLSPFKN